MRILIIGDDDHAAGMMEESLLRAGFQVIVLKQNQQNPDASTLGKCDLLIVQCRMGSDQFTWSVGGIGTDICIPVLALPMAEAHDQKNGSDATLLNLDYLNVLKQLSSWPKSIKRSDRLQVADLIVDMGKEVVSRRGRKIRLSPLAFKLLVYLMQHEGVVIPKQALLQEVWQMDFEPNTTMVATQISRLRDKIDSGFGRRLIHSVRGKGYCLREMPSYSFGMMAPRRHHESDPD